MRLIMLGLIATEYKFPDDPTYALYPGYRKSLPALPKTPNVHNSCSRERIACAG